MSPRRRRVKSVVIDDTADALVRALLRIDPVDAARLRREVGVRRRPRPQVGPRADYGAEEDGPPETS